MDVAFVIFATIAVCVLGYPMTAVAFSCHAQRRAIFAKTVASGIVASLLALDGAHALTWPTFAWTTLVLVAIVTLIEVSKTVAIDGALSDGSLARRWLWRGDARCK